MKLNNIEIALSSAEIYTMLNSRLQQMAYLSTMLKTYRKQTPEQKAVSVAAKGEFSLESPLWRAASSVTHTGTVDQIKSEFRALGEVYLACIDEEFAECEPKNIATVRVD